jgi:dihydroxyacetone kinase
MLDSAKIEIGSQFPGAITVTSQTVTIHNHIFGEYVVNVTMNGNALTMKQVYIFNNSNLIVFTFGDLNSNYPNSVLDFNTMENSIQFN